MLTTLISDHFLIGCTRFLNYTPDPITSFYGCSYRKYSYEAACEFYLTIDRSPIYHLTDVDSVWAILKGFILKCANYLCPKRKITTKLEQPEWATTYILELIADRDSKFIDTKCPSTPAEVRLLRTEVWRAIRNSRAKFITTKLRALSDNPQKFWSEINKLLNRKSMGAKITHHDEDNKPISTEDIPNYINSYFSTIGPNLAKRFYSTTNNTNTTTDGTSESSTATFHTCQTAYSTTMSTNYWRGWTL